MQQFIDLVTSQLEVGESESKLATSGIMDFIRDRLDDASYSKLISQLPGASEFLAENAPPIEQQAADGVLGSLTSMAGGLLGEKGAGIAGVAAAIAASGISIDKVGSFLTTLIGFIRDHLGAREFNELAAQIPDLFGGGR